jgi:hypothetical protein
MISSAWFPTAEKVKIQNRPHATTQRRDVKVRGFVASSRRYVRYEFEEVGFRFCESVIREDPRASDLIRVPLFISGKSNQLWLCRHPLEKNAYPGT